MRIHPTSLAAVAAVLLAGCGSQIPAPSLGPRAVEKQPIDMPVADAHEADTDADAALVARIATLVAAAEAADKAITEQRRRAEAAVARASGAAQGDETWIAAQEAVTALDSARGPLRDTAGAIDALRHDPANAAPGNRAAIDAAAARVAQIDTAAGAALAALAARLS